MIVKSGDLIIAPPACKDPRFHKTVLFLASYPENTTAFCVNSISNLTVSKILDRTDINFDQKMYWGGPMYQQTIWLLHDPGWSMPNTMSVNEHWSITSNANMLESMLNGYIPSRYRLFHGCSTWAPGQLDMEINGDFPWTQDSSWLLAHDPDPDWLLDTDPEYMWDRAVEISGQQAVSSWI
jgi:putative AlgH/UPF0301 family transcriptional regulator